MKTSFFSVQSFLIHLILNVQDSTWDKVQNQDNYIPYRPLRINHDACKYQMVRDSRKCLEQGYKIYITSFRIQIFIKILDIVKVVNSKSWSQIFIISSDSDIVSYFLQKCLFFLTEPNDKNLDVNTNLIQFSLPEYEQPSDKFGCSIWLYKS